MFFKNMITFFQASPNNSSFYPDADCNITELTVTNSGLDLDLYLNGKTSPVASGSDSGISDQSPKADQERSRHESSAYASSNEDEAMLQVHRVEDGTLVIGSSPARYVIGWAVGEPNGAKTM